jgi:hypothetical protein
MQLDLGALPRPVRQAPGCQQPPAWFVANLHRDLRRACATSAHEDSCAYLREPVTANRLRARRRGLLAVLTEYRRALISLAVEPAKTSDATGQLIVLDGEFKEVRH